MYIEKCKVNVLLKQHAFSDGTAAHVTKLSCTRCFVASVHSARNNKNTYCIINMQVHNNMKNRYLIYSQAQFLMMLKINKSFVKMCSFNNEPSTNLFENYLQELLSIYRINYLRFCHAVLSQKMIDYEYSTRHQIKNCYIQQKPTISGD